MLNWKMEIGHPKWNLRITFVDFQFLPCLNATFFIEILRDNHVGEPNLLSKRQVVFPRDTEMMRWACQRYSHVVLAFVNRQHVRWIITISYSCSPIVNVIIMPTDTKLHIVGKANF